MKSNQQVCFIWLTLCLSFSLALSSCTKKQETTNEIRLGYLLNITHAVPMIGLEKKIFSNTKGIHFIAGGYLISSLISGNVDIAYVGPGPYLNAINKNIELILLSGSAVGGNSYVISKEYLEKHTDQNSITKVGIPQYGNTQDLLARKFPNLFNPNQEVTFIAVNPSELETVFFTKTVDAGYVAEPWGTILESKGAKIIENDLTEKLNEYPTTILVVYEPYYLKNKEKVDNFLNEQKAVLELMRTDKEESLRLIQAHMQKLANKKMDIKFLEKSLNKIEFSEAINLNLLEDLMDISLKSKYIKHKTDLSKYLAK